MNRDMTVVTVLLVDDNPDDRALVERELRQHIPGISVGHVGDQQALQAAIERADFDVVVTDYLLRWSTGTDVLREMKRRFPQIPVIMFTGSGNEEVAVSAMKEGLDDYITKTIKHYPRVPHAVLACFDRSRQREQLAQALERETLAKVRLEIALASARMGSWQMDLHSNQITYTADIGPMFGRHEGFVHTRLDDLLDDIHVDDRHDFRLAWQAAQDSQKDLSTRFRTHGPDGVRRWIACSGRVVMNGKETARFMVGTLRDITAEVAAREQTLRQQQELQTIIDVLPVGVAISRDPQANNITLTDYFAKRFGVDSETNVSSTGEDAAARPFRSYRNGLPVAPQELPMQRAARSGVDVRGEELDVGTADGSLLNLLVNASPLRDTDGQVRGAVGALMDVTALKAIQRELEFANLQKTQFLSVLSHELRNPMAAIGYAVELLRHFGAPEVISKARSAIERQAAHMAKLLDDLLDLSRIASNKIDLELKPLDVRRVIELAYESVRSLIEPSAHVVTMELPPEPMFVLGDEVRLTQIFINILGNAAKFTPAKGRIFVNARQSAGKAIVEIIDNGVGIDRHQLEHVFDMFYQGQSKVAGGISGLGIGLAVVHELVSLHNGSVSVHSDGAGQGARFEVQLPLQPGELAKGPDNAADDRFTRHGLLLVADDNADAADALSEVLRMEGHTVVTAYDGKSAMEAAEGYRPDVAILDIGMPQASGNEVARWIRSQSWGHATALIAVTGWGQDEDRKETSEAGFDRHLLKPIPASHIAGLVAEMLPV